MSITSGSTAVIPTQMMYLESLILKQLNQCNVGDLGSIPGLGRFPGEGSGNPLQYSCLENPMDGGHQTQWSPERLLPTPQYP